MCLVLRGRDVRKTKDLYRTVARSKNTRTRSTIRASWLIGVDIRPLLAGRSAELPSLALAGRPLRLLGGALRLGFTLAFALAGNSHQHFALARCRLLGLLIQTDIRDRPL